MIIPLEPSVEGLAERRFLSFARQMLDRQVAGDQQRITGLVEEETVRAPQLHELAGQCDEYTACVRVLGDLAHLRWKLAHRHSAARRLALLPFHLVDPAIPDTGP